MLRSSLLFIHVIAAMGMFAAIGMEAMALAQLRRAPDRPAVRSGLDTLGVSQRVGGPSMLLLVLSGLYLATAYWHWQGAWMGLGFGVFVLIGGLGGQLTGRRVARLRKTLADERSDASLLQFDPVLRTSLTLRTALLAGAVFLMTVKPGPAGSLIAVGTAIGAGFLSLGIRRSKRLPDRASPSPLSEVR